MDDTPFKLCIDCGEEEATIGVDPKRCRDCDLEHQWQFVPKCDVCEAPDLRPISVEWTHHDWCPRTIANHTGKA